MKLLLAAVLAIGANTGCDTLNCFDGAGLEAKYNEGTDRANADNAARFEEGRAKGLSLTRADGEHDGQVQGYSAGFDAGYNSPDGYDAGWRSAYDDGASDGASDGNACSAGGSDGFADGNAAGYGDGYDDGYGAGYSSGYGDGEDDGSAACEAPAAARIAPNALKGTSGTHATTNDRMKPIAPAPATPPADDHSNDIDPAEGRACYTQGYRDTNDSFAYERGFEAGKRENPDYQAGYTSAYTPAFAIGELDGLDSGYRDGAIDGYEAGYADAAGAVYDGCYSEGYDDGYTEGDSDGYSDGHADGYDSGYSDGWNSVTCSE